MSWAAAVVGSLTTDGRTWWKKSCFVLLLLSRKDERKRRKRFFIIIIMMTKELLLQFRLGTSTTRKGNCCWLRVSQRFSHLFASTTTKTTFDFSTTKTKTKQLSFPFSLLHFWAINLWKHILSKWHPSPRNFKTKKKQTSSFSDDGRTDGRTKAVDFLLFFFFFFFFSPPNKSHSAEENGGKSSSVTVIHESTPKRRRRESNKKMIDTFPRHWTKFSSNTDKLLKWTWKKKKKWVFLSQTLEFHWAKKDSWGKKRRKLKDAKKTYWSPLALSLFWGHLTNHWHFSVGCQIQQKKKKQSSFSLLSLWLGERKREWERASKTTADDWKRSQPFTAADFCPHFAMNYGTFRLRSFVPKLRLSLSLAVTAFPSKITTTFLGEEEEAKSLLLLLLSPFNGRHNGKIWGRNFSDRSIGSSQAETERRERKKGKKSKVMRQKTLDHGHAKVAGERRRRKERKEWEGRGGKRGS